MAYECLRCRELLDYCQCAEFVSPKQNEVQTAQSLCYCGHFLSQHSQTRQIASRSSPLKGGCALNGCTKFSSNGREPVAPKSICQCGMSESWLAHSSENSPSDLALQADVTIPHGPTFQPQFSPWQPPEPPNSAISTNGRRVIAYTNHRTAPQASSSTTRTVSNPSVFNNRASRRAAILCHPPVRMGMKTKFFCARYGYQNTLN